MITLYNADIFQDLDNKIPNSSVDLILTDPPYMIGYGNYEWDSYDFVSFTEAWLELVLKKLKSNGTLWSFMSKDNAFTHQFCSKGFVNMLQKYGEVDLNNWTVWARPKGRGSGKHLKSVREEIFHFVKDKNNFTWNNLKMLREVIAPYVKDGKPRGWFLGDDGKRVRWTGLGNVCTYSAPQFNGISEKQFHPSQKPVMLMERLIRLSSNAGDIVLDPFMGSGTTAIACLLSNRNFIGFEKNADYFDFASKRVKEFDIINYPGYNLSTDKEILKRMSETSLPNRTKMHILGNIPRDLFE